MTVRNIYVNEQTMKVTGIGYAPEGEFQVNDKKVTPDEASKHCLKSQYSATTQALNRTAKQENGSLKATPQKAH